MPMVGVKAETMLGLGTNGVPFGFLYYSANRTYQKDGKNETGFMTYLIPFQYDAERQVAHDLQSPEYACAVRTIQTIPDGQQPYPEGANCTTLAVFLGFFGQYLWTTNIPMLKDGVTMHPNEVENLAKKLVNLCDSGVKRVLKRSDSYFSVAGQGLNALVHKKQDFKDATEGSKVDPWNVTLQMVVPCTNPNNYKRVSEIVQGVMKACFERVENKDYKNAMLIAYGEPNAVWTPVSTKKYYKELWIHSVWLLTTELCREKLTPYRMSTLKFQLLKEFKYVFQEKQLFPDNAVWEKYKSDNAMTKGHKPPANLDHFAGVDIALNVATLPAGTPGTPGAAANRKNAAANPNHIIPVAIPRTPAVSSPYGYSMPGTPNVAAAPTVQDRVDAFYFGMNRRQYRNMSELTAFEGFVDHFHRNPSEIELTCYVHWSALSNIPPTEDEWGAYGEIASNTGDYPTVEAFAKYLPTYITRKTAERKAAQEAAQRQAVVEAAFAVGDGDTELKAQVSTGRDW
jgi:hypothetical protein